MRHHIKIVPITIAITMLSIFANMKFGCDINNSYIMWHVFHCIIPTKYEFMSHVRTIVYLFCTLHKNWGPLLA